MRESTYHMVSRYFVQYRIVIHHFLLRPILFSSLNFMHTLYVPSAYFTNTNGNAYTASERPWLLYQQSLWLLLPASYMALSISLGWRRQVWYHAWEVAGAFWVLPEKHSKRQTCTEKLLYNENS